MNVYEKLNAVRTAFLSKEHKKSGKNTFANYQYFELADFLPETLQLFASHGLCGYFHVRDGMAFLDVLNTEKPEEKIVFSCPLGSASLKGCHEIQNIGACITYARRYLWGCVVELIENDALDATSGKDELPRKKEKSDYDDLENPEDWTDVFAAMGDASSVKELAGIFVPAFNKATGDAKKNLEKEYKRLKTILEIKQ